MISQDVVVESLFNSDCVCILGNWYGTNHFGDIGRDVQDSHVIYANLGKWCNEIHRDVGSLRVWLQYSIRFMISGICLLSYVAAFHVILHWFSKFLLVIFRLNTVSCLCLSKVSCAGRCVIVIKVVQSKLPSRDEMSVFPVKELDFTVTMSARFR